MDLASFADYCETSSCSGGRDRIRAREEIEDCLQVDGHGGAARGKKKADGHEMWDTSSAEHGGIETFNLPVCW